MGAIILIAEAAALIWFAAYFGLLAEQYRASAGAVGPRPDPVGRTFVGNAKLAQVAGLGLLALYIAAASLNEILGLGLDLPL